MSRSQPARSHSPSSSELEGRVVFVARSLGDDSGSVSVLVRDQAAALQRQGIGVRIAPLPNQPSLSETLLGRTLRAQLRDEPPAILHAQYGSTTAATSARARDGAALIISFCGDDLLGTPNAGLRWRMRERVARQLGLWAGQRAVRVVVKSRNLRDALPRAMRQKSVVIPNGPDIKFFRPRPKHECRELLGWEPDQHVVLFNASEADNQAVKNRPLAESTVRVLNGWGDRAVLVSLTGEPRERVQLMMNAADALLVTSLHEGSPNVVKEAMACNLLVVSVPCGDVRERLVDASVGEIGPYDAEALAAALQRAMSFEDQRAGRRVLVEQGLTSDDVARRLIELYRVALAESGR
jgi:glycosyltransferase involved in cell wall biosynthesis